VTLDRILYLCAVIIAAGGAVEVLRRLLMAMWRFLRRGEQAWDVLLGDKKQGIKSISEIQAEQAAETNRRLQALEKQAADTQATVEEHIHWHANPGGRPAKAVPPRPNGPTPGRR
jgi:hypothetical protein